jgi:MFS family permease
LFFLSFNLIIAELPTWLGSLGGKEYLPFIIPLFTLSALISRPFSGHLADTVGRRPVIFVGIIASVVCGFAYPLAVGVFAFLLLRFFHGFSTGFAPTGTTTILSDLVSPSRRGEAMGILGISGSLGMASGPFLGSTIALNFSHEAMFITAALFGVASLLVLLTIKETLVERQPFRLGHLFIPKSAIYEPLVFKPAFMAMLLLFPFGVIITVIPDKCDLLNITNRGEFFFYFVAASILIRLPAGRISDKVGRSTLTLVAALIFAVSMVLIALAESHFALMTAAVVTGIAGGINSPVLFAWTADLALEGFRARAFSTTFAALEIGIGSGGLIGGLLYANDPARINLPFWVACAVSLMAATYLLATKKHGQLT